MSTAAARVISTGIGSWPGVDLAEAIKISFAECPELPYLPELPARGPYAGMIGRATALLSGLALDLQPAGWRLTDASGREHRQALATLRSDLDLLEELAQGYAGPVKIAFTGPWTLAASLERPKGDRVLADQGARRDVLQSLTEGLVQLVAELARRLPDVRLEIQLDEPLLPSVQGGSLPTASGLGRHRAVDVAEISDAYRYLIGQLPVEASGLTPSLHCCAGGAPVALLRGAGFQRLYLDLDVLGVADWNALGPLLEEGLGLGLGALPTTRPLSVDQVAQRALAVLRALALDPTQLEVLLTPACGLAGQSGARARQSLRTVQRAAAIVSEELGRE
jgi:methionine synthase II (cobalamin-independent)